VLDKPAAQSSTRASGPLAGFRIVEFAGIGPGPFACMLLADMGAEGITLDRIGAGKNLKAVAVRGRKVIELDLKDKAAVAQVLDLLAGADALIEGFRPGVMERLGLGPDVVMARNPKLVYGRMTGWGQEGPMAPVAGHDINYISVAGALAHFGRAGQPPTPPINMVGDYGGGGMFLAFGVVCAVLEARGSGEGQVVDAAMVEGAAYLMGPMWGMLGMELMSEERGVNLLDTGSPYYDVYETADGEWVSIGSIEPQFYAELLDRTGVQHDDLPHQQDRTGWPVLRERLTEIFETKTRAEWTELLEGTDVCFAPVLPMSEARAHPHVVARRSIVEHDGMDQPAPAPRFSRTAAEIQGPAPLPGEHTGEVLAEWGFADAEIERLLESGAVKQRG
jgi:alpha-methylacyl-CoA racemase